MIEVYPNDPSVERVAGLSLAQPNGGFYINTVGYNMIQGIAYDYANIATLNINTLTEDAFVDLLDINLGSPFKFQWYTHSVGFASFVLTLQKGETNGSYLRGQCELDDNVIADFKVLQSDQNVGVNRSQAVRSMAFNIEETENALIPMVALRRFRVRVMRHGTMSCQNQASGTSFYIGPIKYNAVIF